MDSNDSDPYKVDEYQLPAPPDIIEKMRQQGHSLAELACLRTGEVVESLRKQLVFPEFPHLNRLSEFILDLPLSGLSSYRAVTRYVPTNTPPDLQAWREARDALKSLIGVDPGWKVPETTFAPEGFTDCYWLTFDRTGACISLSGRNDIPASLFEQFPIRAIPGLQEFLRFFGGMAIGWLPPGGGFWHPSQIVCVKRDDPDHAWGRIGEWEGSLTFYHGGSGDQIVLRPDGQPGGWLHEIGWGPHQDEPKPADDDLKKALEVGPGGEISDLQSFLANYGKQDPFFELPFTFAGLVEHLVEFARQPEGPEKQKSPYYY